MEFAEWIVSGLDQLRTGNLPGGQPLYQSVSAGLGGHPVVDAFMNTGDPAARAQLVQLIAQTTATNPGFEQQLRAAAAASQGSGGSGGGGNLGGGGSFVSALKGTWTCGGGTLTIGDGTWSVGSSVSGTWTLNGGKATVTSKNNPGDDITATNVPAKAGAFDILASTSGHDSTPEPPVHVKGLVSAHELNVQFTIPDSDGNSLITCKK